MPEYNDTLRPAAENAGSGASANTGAAREALKETAAAGPEAYLGILKQVSLFAGLEAEELTAVLGCLKAELRSFSKNSFILLAGQEVSNVGVVLSGQVQIFREDISGNRAILAALGPADLFAEAFVCSHTKTMPVSVFSATDSTVLFIDYRRITTGCSSACGFHSRIIQNMMAVLADKNILLSRKIEHLSRRTTREKLLSFLSDQAQRTGSGTFDIPFSRQELADYLCVERSAMSAALSAMKADGLLDYTRNHFTLLEPFREMQE